jgi:hypothetical protein
LAPGEATVIGVSAHIDIECSSKEMWRFRWPELQPEIWMLSHW